MGTAATMTDFPRRNVLRERILRVLFPATVAWSLLLLFAEEVERLQRLNPIPEGGAGHAVLEAMAVWLPVLLTFGVVMGLVRHWPDFLRLPSSLPLTSTIARAIVHGVLLFVAVTVGTVLIHYLFYDPATDPQGQFHIWVWGAGLLSGAALTPLMTVFTAWTSLRRRTRPCDFEVEDRYH